MVEIVFRRRKLLLAGRAALLLAGLQAICAGCSGGGGEDRPEPLLVLAATSLNVAMPELIDRFETRTGTQVDLALGATGNLAAQIENGAPADLFFSADEATVERLMGSGAIRTSTVRTYATGRLVLVWRAGERQPDSLAAIADGAWEVVAIANPEVAPYGQAAREALKQVGIWATVRPRIVQGENVTQTYQLVRTGNADVALVALSVVDTTANRYLPVDPRLHAPIWQAAGVLARSSHPSALPFLEFVLGEEGQTILAAHGFGPAPADEQAGR